MAPAPPPPAVNVTLVPKQKILSASELVRVGTGKAITVNVAAFDVAVLPPLQFVIKQ